MALENLPNFYASISPWIILPIVVWETIWKGLSMWRAARLKQPIWFVALFLLNTLGILQILYYFVFSKQKKKLKDKSAKGRKK